MRSPLESADVAVLLAVHDDDWQWHPHEPQKLTIVVWELCDGTVCLAVCSVVCVFSFG